ncbi:uncharacterized protein [Amphiura filiformis]|uniref:uncharacterized protein n=1 Tax=Amphiura filiformis TaxID=82378 RepID=UPI003B20FAFA
MDCEFRDEEYKAIGDDVEFFCKTELIKKYRPLITARWVKDGFPVNETERVTVDPSTNTLHMTSLKIADHGWYLCQVIYMDTSLVSNEVVLHMGQMHYTTGEDTDSLLMQTTPIIGLPNIWSMSILLSTCLGFILLIVSLGLQIKM